MYIYIILMNLENFQKGNKLKKGISILNKYSIVYIR